MKCSVLLLALSLIFVNGCYASLDSSTPESMVSSEGLFLRQPFAVSLLSRQDLMKENNPLTRARKEDEKVVVRSLTKVKEGATRYVRRNFGWLTEEEEEDEAENSLEKRNGEVQAQSNSNMLQKRGRNLKPCKEQNDCPSDRYCSSKRLMCYKKLAEDHKCSKDYACNSGYCSSSKNVCKAKRANGKKCRHKNSACASGYCSVRTNRCRARQSRGGHCLVSAGCKEGLRCVNGKCHKKHHHHHQPHPTHQPPSPSGSPKYPRQLKSAKAE